MLMSLITFIASANLLGLLPHLFTATIYLSIKLGTALPLVAARVLTGFWHKPEVSLAHFLTQDTPTPLIPILVVTETISLFIQRITFVV